MIAPPPYDEHLLEGSPHDEASHDEPPQDDPSQDNPPRETLSHEGLPHYKPPYNETPHEEASYDAPPSKKFSLEALESKFPSLDDYLLSIKNEFVDQAKNCDPTDWGVITPAKLTQWCAKRRGAIYMTRVMKGLPIFLDGKPKIGYAGAIDLDQKSVFVACDVNGLAVIDFEQVSRSGIDTEKILEITATDSDPFRKARFVMYSSDPDRVIGEMMTMEKREFFWCHLHGLMHLAETDHRTFSVCKHDSPYDAQIYENWPSKTAPKSE
ncbi:hypothetical protein N7456_007554 [Penicillium angulare]|uniref:Uncharacterized protein n=1 Tax=Penicillium angulare TaxID=116970 RepID=A0A9W9FAY3_9EURO|nr:hypothetical protein N7456_007554 [Penicillium angulare]